MSAIKSGKGTSRKAARTLLAALAAAAALALLPGSAAADTVRWYPYEKGMARGKAESKKILINFYATWCTYCSKMDEETFGDRKVAAYLNEVFVPVKVDSEKEPRIAQRYGVSGLPSTWFVDETGEDISNLPGFVGPEMFMNILRYVETESYKSMSFSQFLQSL
jgi:thioredoxin-related protein